MVWCVSLMGRTWRKCACQTEHRQTGHLANSGRWGQCTTKSVSLRKIFLKELRPSPLGSWSKHLHESWKKPMSLVRQDPPPSSPMHTSEDMLSECCGCWYVSWLTKPVFTMWSICLHVMHASEMGKTKERKVRMLIQQDWRDRSIPVRASCSFNYWALVVLETLSCMGFRDNQRFAFSGYSFIKTPLLAFQVNLIFNSYRQPRKNKIKFFS